MDVGGGRMITAAAVSSVTHAGIYYSAARDRDVTRGRNIRLVRRDRVHAIRVAYKSRRRDRRVPGIVRRDDRVPASQVRLELIPLLRGSSTETVTPAGERIVSAR